MGYLKRNNMSSLINLRVYDMIVISSSHANLVRASSLLKIIKTLSLRFWNQDHK
ncbi:hypothetical protein MKW92_003151 [Papaver armeniacum]|nr:hypothetical protein MKW92_003151 [Papaver armeniacum]